MPNRPTGQICEVTIQVQNARTSLGPGSGNVVCALNGETLSGERIVAPDASAYHGKVFTFLDSEAAENWLASHLPEVIAIQQQPKGESTDNVDVALGVRKEWEPANPPANDTVGLVVTVCFSNELSWRMLLSADVFGAMCWSRKMPHPLLANGKAEQMNLPFRAYLIRDLVYASKQDLSQWPIPALAGFAAKLKTTAEAILSSFDFYALCEGGMEADDRQSSLNLLEAALPQAADDSA